MGLVNRVVAPGHRPRGTPCAWAVELAALPQACMRNDRRSALAQWDLPVADALSRRRASASTAWPRGDAVAGAARFAAGAGRGGSTVSGPDA